MQREALVHMVESNQAATFAVAMGVLGDRAIADRDFRNDGIDAGEIGAGHRVTALYEVIPTGQSIPARAGTGLVNEPLARSMTRFCSSHKVVDVPRHVSAEWDRRQRQMCV